MSLKTFLDSNLLRFASTELGWNTNRSIAMLFDHHFPLQWFCCSLVSSVLVVGSSMQASPFLGFHPEAQKQPTSWGKSLHTLHLHEGQLYIGYGDYSANTGPIAIRSYDIHRGTFSPLHLTARTEAISQWRSLNGKVFGVMSDANFEPSQGGYFSIAPTQLWLENLVGPAIHSYDMASYNGDLYLAGAGTSNASGYAAIHKSSNGGVTWTIDLEALPPAGGYGRFYGIHPLGESLYAFATEFVGDASSSSVYQTNGDGWSKVLALPDAPVQAEPMVDLVALADVIVGRTNHAGIVLGEMHGFDGAHWSAIPLPPTREDEPVSTYDHVVAQGALYVLTSDFRIAKTTDLENWSEVVTEVTNNARSLAVVDDCEIYVGGVDAGLYRYSGCLLKP